MEGSAASRGAFRNPAITPIDVHLNYQYRAFGVPGLGLKRGLADDVVIAPYASALRADGGARGGVPRICSDSQRRGSKDRSVYMKRSTIRLPVSRADNRVRWFGPIWPITRA